ncbi:hypothetical protein PVK06_037433 [Gossypium arboreum]|uniref:Radical SAM core domain-containing protein n=1 Tax=Gossypium arboreum TaxID=29729 RepID=A0ABR0MXB9_GOSAR|nr:hypothetical protein PVK06_037433 [Gossypium arboreum]
MATAVLAPDPKKLPRPGRGGFQAHGLTEEEARVRAIAEIVNSMVELSRKNQTVDLNAIKSAACKKPYRSAEAIGSQCRQGFRPDYCLGPHLRQMLSYGCTRLEIGVQSTYEDVARDTNRGHTVAAVADCFCLAKDAGFKDIHHKIRPEEVELVRRDYTANEGWETFLSYEDTRQDILVGLLRLRKCGRNTTCPELMGKCSIVRELHVYGTAVPVHGRDADKLQHQVIKQPLANSAPAPCTLHLGETYTN